MTGGQPSSLRSGSRLLLISEELADLALDRLRESIDSGAAAPVDERRLTRARRAVEKAAALLAEDPAA